MSHRMSPFAKSGVIRLTPRLGHPPQKYCSVPSEAVAATVVSTESLTSFLTDRTAVQAGSMSLCHTTLHRRRTIRLLSAATHSAHEPHPLTSGRKRCQLT